MDHSKFWSFKTGISKQISIKKNNILFEYPTDCDENPEKV